jgi:tetratricopeptide (TPR) repeat protein
MPAGKKITKKQLKQPDEFLTFTDQAFHYVINHGKKFVIGGIVVLVVVLSIVLFRLWQDKKEGEANQKLTLALEAVEAVISPAPQTAPAPATVQGALEKLDEIIKGFPRTYAGRLALIYKGSLLLKTGQFDEAIQAYQTFLSKMGKERAYGLLALDGLGFAYEGKKEYEKAIESYRQIITTDEKFESGEAYLKVGRCYEKLGKSKEAVENYQSFLKASPKSLIANAVSRKVSLLGK